ncbi:MAG: signal peptide peptidase SppA [Verrucomicrobiota bacterium]
MEENSGSPPLPPPAAAPPPPVISPPPRPTTAPLPAEPRRGRGWMIFALVLLVLLTFSVLWNLLSLIGSLGLGEGARYSRPYGPRIEEAVVSREAHAVDKIAVVPVYGVIIGQGAGEGGFVSADVVKAELRRALEDDDVKAVILKVDSPGGEVLASDEIYRAIAEFQKRKNGKPVVASMGDLAASGGYYVSSPCRWIVAHELTITGSIGVIMHGWNYRGLMDKVGVRPEVYKSGRFKDMLSGEREPDQITPQEREMVQALIDETFGRFKTVVAEGRKWARQKNGSAGAALSSDWANYADGRVLSGTEAYKLGFVDQLGTFEDAVEHAKKVAGIASANVVQYQQRYDLADLFRLFGKTDSKVLKVDLGLDAPKLRAGQLYFLSPTFLH